LKKLLALGMLGLLVAFAMALGTTATFRDFEVSRSVHIDVVADDDELIDLHPGQPYAYINDKGMLVIDISPNNPNWPGNPDSPYYNETWAEMHYGIGISPGASYNFDHVFYVSNDLWEETTIVVRVVSSSGNVKFYHPSGLIYKTGTNSTPTRSDVAQKDVCFVLEPGDEVGLGMEFFGSKEFTPPHMYNSTITVYAWPSGKEPINCGGG